ncbi:S1C family serine protease [Bacillus sp. Marseille-P3661]|uniref:S1C family serine protease n=1 Tax=Bacillus sp. Marseille-P3661 TaxID=1936234 RepID=UPI000C855878|nr:S1C family serine protease [Bacillus sp. Marseille-P3661]
MGYYKPYKSKLSKYSKPLLLGSLIGIVLTAFSFLLYFNPLMKSEQKVVAEQVNDNSGAIEKNFLSYDNTYMSIPRAVEKVDDAVVSITNYQNMNYFTLEPQKAGIGSGVIYKKAKNKAYIVTNYHVIDGGEKLEVTLSDGTKLPAELVGGDIFTDLAVLKIDGEHVSEIANLGSSDNLTLGEPVIAIGSPLGDAFSGSVTQGILSGKERTIPVDINKDGKPDWQADVIQTDAAINPGNSGGALVNIVGEVIGINSMKIAQDSVEGIGFAIPISIAKPVINDLERYREVKRPYLGISLETLSNIPTFHWTETFRLPDDVKKGVAILEVVPNSPAARAGLNQYDIIVALDDKDITNDVDLRKYIYTKKKIGEEITIKYYRNGKEKTTELTLVPQNSY